MLPKGAKILDVGCGPGGDVKFFLEMGYFAQGIDMSKEMIKIAKRKVPDGIFSIMDMRRLGYIDESFDGVFAAYSLIHIPAREVVSTLKEFNRVLKKGGVMFLAVREGRGEGFIKEPLDETKKIFVKSFTQEELDWY